MLVTLERIIQDCSGSAEHGTGRRACQDKECETVDSDSMALVPPIVPTRSQKRYTHAQDKSAACSTAAKHRTGNDTCPVT